MQNYFSASGSRRMFVHTPETVDVQQTQFFQLDSLNKKMLPRLMQGLLSKRDKSTT